ncbi:hypothetical protein TrVE_jg1082 [Triparma verrucosa]|uniref:CCR4-NOT transcription complex subunit 1 n=1 Tax=Triparma verrucosa TaxID=1606542 RepID=A0A9W7CGB1_9STRA|nr:hypothetical protein TrVE_jg1082 [Triparma verrucosa]
MNNLHSSVQQLRSAVDVVRIVNDLGPSVTSSTSSFRGLIQRIPSQSLDEQSIGSLIGFFAKTASHPASPDNDDLSQFLVGSLTNDGSLNKTAKNGGEGTTGSSDWNYDVVARVFAEDYKGLNWTGVAQWFDSAEFYVADLNSLNVVLKLYRAGSNQPSLPYPSLFSSWRNNLGQLSLIAALITAPAELYTFQLNEVEAQDFLIGNPFPSKAWSCVALTSHLLMLSDHPNTQIQAAIRNLFRNALISCPEQIVLALVKIQQAGTGQLPGQKLIGEMMSQLLQVFFKPGRSAYSGHVIKRLWDIFPKFVVSGCVESWRSVASSPPTSEEWLATVMHIVGVVRLLSREREAEAGIRILSGGDIEYVLSIAFVAGDKDVIKLDTFLLEKINSEGMQFAFPLVAFVGKNYMAAVPRSEGHVPISIENIAVALKTLANCNKELQNQPTPNNNTPLSASIKALTEACIAKHPSLAHASVSSDEIEEMANSYFQKIYTSEQSIGEVIEMLKRFKTSENSREQDIFACMIHNLFDEYRFFHKYPDKELRITGVLFGTLIQHQLVSSITLGIALRYVLEALRKQPVPGGSGKMFRFGMFAVEQFKNRLHEWPQYCSHIIQIPHLKQSHAQLVSEIEAVMQKAKAEAGLNSDNSADQSAQPNLQAVGQPDLTAKSPNSMSMPSSSDPSSFSMANNAATGSNASGGAGGAPAPAPVVFGTNLGKAVSSTGPETEHPPPPDNILDRIQFIINNISMSNLDGKVQELREIMNPQWFGWLGNYLVVKRISTQPNFHSLYLAFLEKLGDYGRGLVDAILLSVYLNVGKLLRSPKITILTSERSLLKNLGSWLGAITLARNKPILHRMLDCKELLYQGYETGRLIAVTPFVAKILEGAKNSVVFRPPNPWVMGLLSVFKSLYDVEDLKMNIKFEVEVLCKNLNVKLDEIEKGDELLTRVSPNKEKNPDFNTKSVSSTPAAVVDAKVAAAGGGENFQEQTVIPNLAAYVQINPSVALFSAHPVLKRVVPVAVDRAIREIIQPVVERSVTIACITTKELIVKDFAMESDENKMRKAAQLMVSNLAGSLALVTCKEPLRGSVATNLRNLLQSAISANNITPMQEHEQLIEQVVQVCATDNLELGCMLIEKAATEKAMRDIDEALAAPLQTRRKHREQTGQPFYDMSIFNNARYPNALPEPLRPKPGGLGAQQLMVYEAFQRIPRQPVVAGAVEGGVAGAAGAPPAGAGVVADGNMKTLTMLAQKLNMSVNSLLAAAGNRSGEVTYMMLPENHEVKSIITEIRKVVGASSDDVSLSFAQTIFKQMYDLTLNEPLRLESLIEILTAVNEGCSKLSKDVTVWITYAPMSTEEEKKLHRTVLLLLVRAQLVKINELDAWMSHSMKGGTDGVWVEFAMYFVRTAVHERITSVSEIPNVIDTFTKISQKQGNYKKSVNKLLDDLRGSKAEGGNAEGGDNAPVQPASTAAPISQQQKGVAQPAISKVDSSEGLGVSDIAAKNAEAIALASRNDPPQTRQSVTHLLDYWIRVYNETPGNEKAYAQYLQLLQQHGVGKSEENSERFFRVSTELVIEAVLKSGQPAEGGVGPPVLHYNVVDAYAKLVALLFKYMNSGGDASKVATQRINLLNKVLGITVQCLMASSVVAKNNSQRFDQRPWFRLLMNLIQDLNLPDPQLDSISLQILGVFGSALHVIQPCVIPGFTFAWLELVSHRMFLPNLLLAKGQKGFGLAHQLLLDLFQFLEPYLKKGELDDSIRTLYKGTLRVLLILLHDFPEFLAEYHASFTALIPNNCVQLRNIFLSAFPRSMSLIDPFTPNLKIDLLPEISQPPRILSNITGALGGVRADIDVYLKTRGPPTFLAELPGRLLNRSGEVNASIVNSLVIYVGMEAMQKEGSMRGGEMDILTRLLEFPPKNRYACICAIANQLRYPNSHTHYFSQVVLFLFQNATDEGVKEQITRCLLERLIVHRPHPWGLLITFIELIKNPRYAFWSHSFTRCAAEIERVFESVSRSCMAPNEGAGEGESVGIAKN